jgi:hypothetical protein
MLFSKKDEPKIVIQDETMLINEAMADLSQKH